MEEESTTSLTQSEESTSNEVSRLLQKGDDCTPTAFLLRRPPQNVPFSKPSSQ